jgi:cell division septation protein DedD
VQLLEANSQADALALYDRLRGAGYAAEIRPVKSENAMLYRVRLSNLPSRADAQALANMLKGTLGVSEPTISM